MSKHSLPISWPANAKKAPAHSAGWTPMGIRYDRSCGELLALAYTPGKHAKPFGKHVAIPAIYDSVGNVTPLRTVEHRLDVAA